MGRPKGSRNKRTLLKEAEQHVGSKYVDQVIDSLYVIETAMRHFFNRAEMGKNAGRRAEEVDEDYKQAATLAALAAPYRHARLSKPFLVIGNGFARFYFGGNILGRHRN
jgi:hypothetical protein